MKRNKKIAAIIGAGAGAVVLVGGGALALFTDSAFRNTGGYNGVIDINVTNLVLDNPDNINPGDNDHDEDKTYVPVAGDPLFDENDPGREVTISTTSHDLTFTVTNNGNKSFRQRQTFIVYAYNDQVESEDLINYDDETIGYQAVEELSDAQKEQITNAINVLVHNAESWNGTNNVGPGHENTPEEETEQEQVLSVADQTILVNRMKDARVYSLWNTEGGADGETCEELPGKTYIGSNGIEYENLEDLDAAVDADGNQVICWAVKYQFTPDVYEGCGLQAELEPEALNVVCSIDENGDGVYETAASKLYTYELSMDKYDSLNQYQGAEVHIDATFEAMQYRNTSQDDWDIVTTKSISGYTPYDWELAPDRSTD